MARARGSAAHNRLARREAVALGTAIGLVVSTWFLNGRIDKLGGRMDGLGGKMEELSGKFDRLTGRVDALETSRIAHVNSGPQGG